MHYQGAGSRESPIAIEDSEEEVLQELRAENSSSASASPSNSSGFQRPTLEQRLVGLQPAGTEHAQDFYETDSIVTGKRKRTDSDARRPLAPPNPPYPPYPPYSHAGYSPSAPLVSSARPLLSKKARKRQRKAERQALIEAQAQAFPQLPHHVHAHTQALYDAFIPPTIPSMLPYLGMVDQSTPLPDYPDIANASTSAWVSSMAHAGGVSVPFSEPNYTYLPPPEWHPLPSAVLDEPIQQNPVPLEYPNPPQPATRLPPVSEPPAAPPPEKPVERIATVTVIPRIGMDPELDTASMHGLFELPPTKGGTAYQPNPARTLVVEQLPKQHRNKDFMNSWSKKACGSTPAYVLVDPPRAKALLEFSTAEHARKCWTSPKLGQELIGLPTNQLKGKPRLDLVKAWWYRLPGTGANSGVGEIEEGEIEGDEEGEIVEIQLPQPVKEKETKKERKARLAKERAEKEASSKAASFALPTRPESIAAPPNLPPIPVTQPPIQPKSDPKLPPIPTQPRNVHPLPLRPNHEIVHRPVIQTSSMAQQMSISTGQPHSSSSTRGESHNFYQPVAPTTDEETLDSDDMEIDSPEVEAYALKLPANPPVHKPVYAQQPETIAAPQPRIPPTNNGYIGVAAPNSTVQTPAGTQSNSPLPSEPRAMKKPPTAPSFAKRALLAKQKELEQRISQQKQQLGLSVPPSALASNDNSVEVSPLATPPMTPPLVSTPNGSTRDNQAMEDRLRALVLKSKVNKLKLEMSASASPSPTPTVPAAHSPAPEPAPSTTAQAATNNIKPSQKLNLTANTGSGALSMEELAVSFITETIQTAKPVKVPQLETDSKAQLAARQRQLEQHIAETKILMEQLSKAKTKAEKDRIFAVMRQQSRLHEENMSNGTKELPSPSTKHLEPSWEKVSILNTRSSSLKMMPTVTVKWPESRHDANILIISDDEESDDE